MGFIIRTSMPNMKSLSHRVQKLCAENFFLATIIDQTVRPKLDTIHHSEERGEHKIDAFN